MVRADNGPDHAGVTSTLTSDEYRAAVTAWATAVQQQFLRIAVDTAGGSFVQDRARRGRLTAAYDDLWHLFTQVRTLQPPACLQPTHDTVLAAIERYTAAVGHRRAGLALMEQEEAQRGLDAWHRAQPLEEEAQPLVVAAAQQLRTARC